MKIFVSWSGPRSRAVAELLSDWVKCVLQAAQPWLSTRDIDRGALWFTEINEQLKETSIGIVCLTQDNKAKPWILFESGALAKGLSTNRVCTLLIDLQPSDLDDPLAQFNHTLPDHDGLWRLVQTLNGCLGPNSLDARTMGQVFQTYWPQFEVGFREALERNPLNEPPQQRSESETLSQILEGVRTLGTRVGRLESKNDLGTRNVRWAPGQIVQTAADRYKQQPITFSYGSDTSGKTLRMSRELLQSLGFKDEQINTMIATGIVAEPSSESQSNDPSS